MSNANNQPGTQVFYKAAFISGSGNNRGTFLASEPVGGGLMLFNRDGSVNETGQNKQTLVLRWPPPDYGAPGLINEGPQLIFQSYDSGFDIDHAVIETGFEFYGEGNASNLMIDVNSSGGPVRMLKMTPYGTENYVFGDLDNFDDQLRFIMPGGTIKGRTATSIASTDYTIGFPQPALYIYAATDPDSYVGNRSGTDGEGPRVTFGYPDADSVVQPLGSIDAVWVSASVRYSMITMRANGGLGLNDVFWTGYESGSAFLRAFRITGSSVVATGTVGMIDLNDAPLYGNSMRGVTIHDRSPAAGAAQTWGLKVLGRAGSAVNVYTLDSGSDTVAGVTIACGGGPYIMMQAVPVTGVTANVFGPFIINQMAGSPVIVTGTNSVQISSSVYVGGDVLITGSANGLVLRSPDNTRWRLTVDNSGVLSTTSF